MSLKAYLAEKYMSGPKADAILSKVGQPKKKKRKTTSTSASTSTASASFIKDDDLMGWNDAPRDDDEDMEDAVVAEDRRFKKRQRTDPESGWQTVQEGAGGRKTPPPAEDEKPQVVMQEDEPAFTGGLLTSAQLKKKLPKHRPQEAKRSAEEEAAERAAAQETVYRDASGRKVDIAAEKAEAARLKREREAKEAAKMEWGKGLVQREETEKRRKEEAAMRNQAFARTADDAELNNELKEQERWNDPAAAFLTVGPSVTVCLSRG
ncbi:Pre-mRNA-splicing factor of RES complex-domain-containing protein [Trametes elegans]|nr:Pre-mRNA-splicing factor of RES complex-domain-containing protein [Trametes elegans]